MGRPRSFDETEAIVAAAGLFAGRAYDGVSVDDLVAHLGVHRNSLYKVFGSKRGLYLAALRWHLAQRVRPLADRLRAAADPARVLRDLLAGDGAGDLDLLLLATVERAPQDPEVAREVADALRDLDEAVDLALGGTAGRGGAPSPLAQAFTATILGARLRTRTGAATASGAVLFDRMRQPEH